MCSRNPLLTKNLSRKNQITTYNVAEHQASLPSTTAEGQARREALHAAYQLDSAPTSKVAFQSTGKLLIIGAEPAARAILETIDTQISCTILVVLDWHQESQQDQDAWLQEHVLDDGRKVNIVKLPLASLSGHFGRFEVEVSVRDKNESLVRLLNLPSARFDFVLDLSRNPVFSQERLPEGYFNPKDSDSLQRAVADIPGLIGEFEKPRYVEYFDDRCAHSERGLTGCTRCIDACSTLAIRSVGERIEVDPYLCQGAGCCASVCPTSALVYTYPRVEDTTEQIRSLIQTFLQKSETEPVLVFHNAEEGARRFYDIAGQLPEHFLPVSVEELGSIGWDIWLSALSYGAAAVVLLVDIANQQTEAAVLKEQLGYANALLAGLAFPPPAAHIIDSGDQALIHALSSIRLSTLPVKAVFSAQADKRTQFRLLFDHLYDHAPGQVDSVELPTGAPFGDVKLDFDACTLCMACTSVCPRGALLAGDETPQLRFNEWNCVQCGMCETACPENAISYQARILCNPEVRRNLRILKEEEPFHCVECGKPFATPGVIAKMQEQLKDHRMFAGDGIRRLQMCEDCRVKDMFDAEGDLLH